MNVTVEKNDIKKIGNTAFNKNGNLAIVCNGETSNIEEILLRSILKCFGEEYKVISSEDNIWVNVKGEEVYDILFTTNLPYELFEEVWHSEDSDAGTMPDTPKKSNKIVKSILTIIMLVFIGLAANAQEVHGYGNLIAEKLTSHGLIVEQSGYDVLELSDSTYTVKLLTPKFYDEETTRLTVISTMKGYSDITMYQPWKIEDYGSLGTYVCDYDGLSLTVLFFHIVDKDDKDGRVTVFVCENLIKKQ